MPAECRKPGQASMGLENNVRFLGFQKGRRYFGRSWASMVLTSISEAAKPLVIP